MEVKMNFNGTITIKQEEEWFVASCLENNIASQGKTIDTAIALYYEDENEEEMIYPKMLESFTVIMAYQRNDNLK